MTQKQRQILIKSLSWFITLFIIIFIGITGVFADTYNATQFTVEGYDNYGPSLSKVTTDFTNNSWRWTIPTMTANTSGTAFIFNSPIPLIANHTYTVTSQINNSWGTCIGISTYNRIGLGTSISSSKSSYENNTNVNEIYSNKSTCDTIQFAFTPTINGTWLTIPFNTTSNANNITFTINNIVIDDLGSKSLTQDEINNSLTNQTNILNANINAIGQDTSTIINQNNQINDNINAVGQDTSTIINQNNNLLETENQNKQDIINNQNANNEALIDNNNKNTQDLIDDNKKNFQTCRESKNILNLYNLIYKGGSSISPNIIDKNTINFTTNSQGYGYSFYEFDLPITDLKGKTIYLSFKSTNINSRILMRLYDSNNSSIGSNYSSEINIPSDTSASYLGIRFYPSYNVVNPGNQVTFSELMMSYEPIIEYEPYGEEICVNKLDEQNKTSKGILGKIGDLFNTLFSNEDADISGLDNMVGWLPPGPVDSIINLPLSLFNALTNTLSGTCTPISLTLPFVNANLTLPCFDTFMSQYLTGFSTFWNWLGITVSVFILYNYLLNLYKWIDDTLTMRENNLPGYYDDNMWGGA